MAVTRVKGRPRLGSTDPVVPDGRRGYALLGNLDAIGPGTENPR